MSIEYCEQCDGYIDTDFNAEHFDDEFGGCETMCNLQDDNREQRMKNIIIITIITLLVLAILGLSIWWTIFKFKDCKNVGHSNLYCWGKVFE